MTMPPDGLLLVDKPLGPTSHDVVDLVRRGLGTRRVGHTGTLDPQAGGLLALVVGTATRLARFIPAAPKTYTGTIRLGVTTDTDDMAGRILTRHQGPLPEPEAVAAAAAGLTGRGLQVPPSVSARRVEGERLYRWARRGVPVSPAPSEVVVLRFALQETADESLVGFEAVVSAGTYLRALARDLGAALGCGGAIASLRRTAIGPLTLDGAIALEPSLPPSRRDLEAAIVPIASMPLAVSSITIEGAGARGLFFSGRAVPWRGGNAASGTVAVRDPSGAILGIGVIDGEVVRPRVVLPELRVAPEGAV